MRTHKAEPRLTGEFIVAALRESDANLKAGIVKMSRAALGLVDIFESNTAGSGSRERSGEWFGLPGNH